MLFLLSLLLFLLLLVVVVAVVVAFVALFVLFLVVFVCLLACFFVVCFVLVVVLKSRRENLSGKYLSFFFSFPGPRFYTSLPPLFHSQLFFIPFCRTFPPHRLLLLLLCTEPASQEPLLV